jgi:ribosomal protein L32
MNCQHCGEWVQREHFICPYCGHYVGGYRE